MRWTPRCFFWDFTVPVLWWQNFWWQNGRIIAEMLRFLKPVMKRKNHWNMVIKSLNNWNIDALSQWWVENTIDILMWLFSDEWKEPLIYRRTSQWWKEKELSKHFDYFFCDQPTKQTNEKRDKRLLSEKWPKMNFAWTECVCYICTWSQWCLRVWQLTSEIRYEHWGSPHSAEHMHRIHLISKVAQQGCKT